MCGAGGGGGLALPRAAPARGPLQSRGSEVKTWAVVENAVRAARGIVRPGAQRRRAAPSPGGSGAKRFPCRAGRSLPAGTRRGFAGARPGACSPVVVRAGREAGLEGRGLPC